MGEKAIKTKDRILETAERIILQRGFSGTSIDEIINQSHITKGGFFYHFKGKNDLAKKLIERYLVADDIFFEQLFARARRLVEDPLQQMLLFLKLMAEAMEQLPDTHPGCLAASFVYESQQFDKEVLNLIETGITNWRKLFVAQLELINSQYKPRQEYDVTMMADFLTASVEGGIILSLITKDQNQLVQHILHYRNYLHLLYGK